MIDQNELLERIKISEKVLEGYYVSYVKSIENLASDNTNLNQRLEKLEHFFSGKIKNPIHETITLHVENFEERIKKIESAQLIQQLTPKVWKFITERIDKIEEMTLNGLSIEAYVKLSDRVLELEKWKQSMNQDYVETKLAYIPNMKNWIEQNFKNVNERIDELEEWTRKDEDKIYEKLKELETEINIVRALGSRAFHPKKPYKCPACDGKCHSQIEVESMVPKFEFCKACEGKGIVWG